MDSIKPFFPINNKVEKGNGGSLAIVILIYLAISVVCGIILGVLSLIPFVGILTGILGTLIGLYNLAGIILAIIAFLQ